MNNPLNNALELLDIMELVVSNDSAEIPRGGLLQTIRQCKVCLEGIEVESPAKLSGEQVAAGLNKSVSGSPTEEDSSEPSDSRIREFRLGESGAASNTASKSYSKITVPSQASSLTTDIEQGTISKENVLLSTVDSESRNTESEASSLAGRIRMIPKVRVFEE